jgi:cytochrome d ubiquinol oxidase subunit II
VDLPTIWFVAIAVLWTGYFVLEGFDFGVGTLLPVLGRDDTDRRVMLNAIGPVWDGNEVWLITAVGAMFAAFPAWYAATFSGFYLPVLLVLVALIVRGVGLEYRAKAENLRGLRGAPIDAARWRARWDVAILAGSAVPAFLWGLVFANLLRGVRTGARGEVTSGVLDLLNPYALLGGFSTLALFTVHGAVFLALKTDGPVRHRARAAVRRIAWVAVPVVAAFLHRTQADHGAAWTAPVAALAVAALLAGVLLAGRGREGWSFAATAGSVVALSVTVFESMFPDLLPSLTDPQGGLTVTGAASAPYTLTILSWVGAVFLPLVIAYQSWSYWVFRRRVSGPVAGPVPAEPGRP